MADKKNRVSNLSRVSYFGKVGNGIVIGHVTTDSNTDTMLKL